MSVQAAVALLNKNATSSSSGACKLSSQIAPPSPPVKLANTCWRNSNPTEKKESNAELKRIRTTSGGGVASMLSKFDQHQHARITTNTTTITQPNTNTTTINTKTSSSSLNKRATATQSTLTSDNKDNRGDKIDVMINELTCMYETIMQQYQAAQTTIEQLQTKEGMIITKDSNVMSSQIRDYEIRIQYLSDKLEQMSQEHEELEQQLASYRSHQDNDHHLEDASKQRRITVETNTTRSDQPDDFWNCLLDTYDKSSVSTGCTSARTSNENDEETMSCDKEVVVTVDHEQLLSIKKQMSALERGAHMMFELQAGELESERIQTRALTEVVRKQDKLIAALESQLSSTQRSNDQLLLQEQMELQRIELEDKRALLARLLDEREDLLKRTTTTTSPPCKTPNRSRSASVRSSIDILSEMSRTDSTGHPLSRASCSSLRQQQQQQQQQLASTRSSLSTSLHLGRSTPPLTAPPRDPLPPLPARSSVVQSSTSISTLSPASSWSSADYAAIKAQDICSSTVYRETTPRSPSPAWLDHPPPHHSIIATMPSSSSSPTSPPPPPPQSSTTNISRQPTIKLSRKSTSNNNNSAFWKGWKHRLGSR
ncbi:hypothetical protein O0I10_002138 [Lichtheimia ornata]|uniref:Uncharacterized protein n=1 Tax=Lichtheimia ornata TaxID=688661 RepID=A0AAD7VB94_9FUNG|nr:uncharacterized protein O0I10_002138 [Lichtheimia ornata]KAJ8662444.1 hypothetical protein O0I10_002138 [Lichtheimia ornata]